jgi:hypothetical protein
MKRVKQPIVPNRIKYIGDCSCKLAKFEKNQQIVNHFFARLEFEAAVFLKSRFGPESVNFKLNAWVGRNSCLITTWVGAGIHSSRA